MRRPVAFLVLAVLTLSQLTALGCDMGASAHHDATVREPAVAHETVGHGALPAHHGNQAASHEGCLMMACADAVL